MQQQHINHSPAFLRPPQTATVAMSQTLAKRPRAALCQVTLHAPPPLDRALSWSASRDGPCNSRDWRTRWLPATAKAYALTRPYHPPPDWQFSTDCSNRFEGYSTTLDCRAASSAARCGQPEGRPAIYSRGPTDASAKSVAAVWQPDMTLDDGKKGMVARRNSLGGAGLPLAFCGQKRQFWHRVLGRFAARL